MSNNSSPADPRRSVPAERAPPSAKSKAASARRNASARPSKRDERSRVTQERILDSAEFLFALHGFHGVTLRQVATESGVDTALLHYYFQSKVGLFDAVFMRRAEVINRERMESLNAYEREVGEAVTVEGAIAAFLRPVMEWCLNGGPGWKSYFSIVGQTNTTPMWGGETMARYFDPVIQRLVDIIAKALPTAGKIDLYWSYHLLSGALTLTLSETGRIDRLSGGLCRSSDLRAIEPRMVEFAAAGFRALCAAQADAAQALP